MFRFRRERVFRLYRRYRGELFRPRGREIGGSYRGTGEDVVTHEQFVPHGAASFVGEKVGGDVVRGEGVLLQLGDGSERGVREVREEVSLREVSKDDEI